MHSASFTRSALAAAMATAFAGTAFAGGPGIQFAPAAYN